MPKTTFGATAEGLPADIDIGRLIDDVGGHAYDLRCLALLLNEKINAAFFPGVCVPAESYNFYVDSNQRTLLCFVVVMLLDRATKLDADFQSLEENLRANR